MKFVKTFTALTLGLGLASGVFAAGFEAGKGVANDLATGENKRDVTFIERGGNNNYGWQSYDLAVGLTVLPWSVPNSESSVYGLRFDFGWGAYENTSGLDLGVFGVTTRDFGGLGIELLGNAVGGTMGGVQIGCVNIVSGTAYGLQIGVVNFAETLYGVQIGVLNFNNSGVKCLPILNAAF